MRDLRETDGEGDVRVVEEDHEEDEGWASQVEDWEMVDRDEVGGGA